MNYTTIICPYCKKESSKYVGHVKRANKIGAPIYCTKACSGLARRLTQDEKKAIKKAYDVQYREKNIEHKKAMAKAYFQRTYDPAKAAVDRKKRYKRHLELLNTPKYKAWKKEYDLKHLARKNYGEFWEAAIILNQLESHIDQRQAKQDSGVFNKAHKRKQSQS